jgi:hypothetical protein
MLCNAACQYLETQTIRSDALLMPQWRLQRNMPPSGIAG